MIEKFEKILKNTFPKTLKKDKILVAVSGGVDSMVLCFLLSELNYKIAIVTCDFGLRKESKAEVHFVKKWAEQNKKPFYSEKFDTKKDAQKNKISIQMAARNLRYDYFEKLCQKNKYPWIATAHHLDDSLETFLIHLGRASGLKGLLGIPKIQGKIIRPLLDFSKNELMDFAKQKNIVWKEDSSNAKTDYLRNQLRHMVIPELKKINAHFLKNFSESIRILKENQNFITQQITFLKQKILQKKDENTFEIDLLKLEKIANPKMVLYEILKDFGFKNEQDLEKMSIATSGKQIFSKSHRLLKNRDFWMITTLKKPENKTFLIQKNTLKISEPFPIFFEKTAFEKTNSPKIIYVNSDILQFPLQLRKWQAGDFFYPFGMQGKKKLSKFFVDEKYSLLEKEQCFVLCDNSGKIIWIVGKRADDRFKVQKNTQNILKIFILK